MARRSPPAKAPDWPPEKALPLLKEQLRRLQDFKGKKVTVVERAEDEWEQFTRSVIIHAFGENSENLNNYYSARSSGVYNMMGISDHQRQLNFELRISQYEATLNSSIRELEVVLPVSEPHPIVVVPDVRPGVPARVPGGDEPLILISHSSKDLALATALVEFLRAGLLTNKIRCSSVDGYRLPAGVQTEAQLRAEVNSTEVLIGLITPNSLASAYVMFELGARWGAGSFMVPLLAGVNADEIRGPLSGINALRADNDSQLHQLLTDVGKALGKDVERPASYVAQLSALKAQAGQIRSLPHIAPVVAAPPESQPLKLSLAVIGTPPSPQMLRVQASHPVKAVRLEYLLSTGVCVATDNVDAHGDIFDLPIEDHQVLKMWNTPRHDMNFNDQSGPAKLRLTVSNGDKEMRYLLPIQMDAYFVKSTMYRRLVGSEVFQ